MNLVSLARYPGYVDSTSPSSLDHFGGQSVVMCVRENYCLFELKGNKLDTPNNVNSYEIMLCQNATRMNR